MNPVLKQAGQRLDEKYHRRQGERPMSFLNVVLKQGKPENISEQMTPTGVQDKG